MAEAIYTFLASIGVGVLGWAVMIEPRLQVLQTKQEDQKELIETKLTSIDKRLERIERRILNGSVKGDGDGRFN